jgi:hypothetical protein
MAAPSVADAEMCEVAFGEGRDLALEYAGTDGSANWTKFGARNTQFSDASRILVDGAVAEGAASESIATRLGPVRLRDGRWAGGGGGQGGGQAKTNEFLGGTSWARRFHVVGHATYGAAGDCTPFRVWPKKSNKEGAKRGRFDRSARNLVKKTERTRNEKSEMPTIINW